MKGFDKKFGAEFLQNLPTTPAIYLFKDEQNKVLYVGKAKNIRRRLQNYRNASRRKHHRKMCQIVHAASILEIVPQPSERDALLLENKLIQQLKPRFNVEGTYTFLYPAIGLGSIDNQTLCCLTTKTTAWKALNLNWYGVFRSRLRTKEAFAALTSLLAFVAHLEPRSRLPNHPHLYGSLFLGFRRLPKEILIALESFLSGNTTTVLEPLVEQLLEKHQARRQAAKIQDHLKQLKNFHTHDILPLRNALLAAGCERNFIGQQERDALFLATDIRWRPTD